jgi:Secretion system C-terminal sorting domain
MKKIILTSLLMASYIGLKSQSANNPPDELQVSYNTIYSQLNNAKITTGYLYQQGIHYRNIRYYSGTTDSVLKQGIWEDVYTQLAQCRRVATAYDLPSFKTIKTSINALYASKINPIVIFDFRCQDIKYNVKETNLMDVNATTKKLLDLTAVGSATTPYNINTIFAASPANYTVGFDTVKFRLSSQFYFSNYANYAALPAIQIDFGDGLGFVAVAWNSTKNIVYPVGAEKTIKVRKMSGSTVLAKSAGLYVRNADIFASNSLAKTANNGVDEIVVTATIPYAGAVKKARVVIKYGKNSFGYTRTNIEKPLIFADGIDFPTGEPNVTGYSTQLRKCNGLGFYDIYDEIDYRYCKDRKDGEYYSEAQAGGLFDFGRDFIDGLNNDGYDFIFVDFYDGAALMQQNAMVMVEVIKEVNSRKSSATCYPNIIGGASMGGQVSKYALTYMEKNNIPHNGSVYLGFDTPHNGANIPIGFVELVKYFANPNFPKIPFEQFKESLENKLGTPAAKQLLINWDATGESAERTAWLSELNTNGQYPKKTFNIGIASGSGNNTKQPGMASTGGPLVSFVWKPAVAIGAIVGTVGGTIQSGPIGAVLGGAIGGLLGAAATAVLPLEYRGDAYLTPGNGQNKIFIGDKPGYNNLVSINKPSAALNLDNSPGGQNNATVQGDGCAKTWVSKRFDKITDWTYNDYNIKFFSFIPTNSALALKAPYDTDLNFNPYTDLKHSFNSIQNTHIFEKNKTYLDDVYFPSLHFKFNNNEIFTGSDNQPHVKIEEVGQLWVREEMKKIQPDLATALPAGANTSYNFGNDFKRTLVSCDVNSGGVIHVNKSGNTSYGAGVATIPNSKFTLRTISCTQVNINPGGKMVVGDAGINNTGEVIFEQFSNLRIFSGGILEIQDGSKVIIEAGAGFYLAPGATIRLMGSAATLEIRDANYNLEIPIGTSGITFTKHTAASGGQFIWKGNLSWAAGSTNKLISTGVTLKCNGAVTYNNGNQIELNKSDACLEIAGNLFLGANAKFTFTKSALESRRGYVKFSCPAITGANNTVNSLQNIVAGTGASMEFIGDCKTCKIVEINQYWLLLPDALKSLKIDNGLVMNSVSTGFGEISVPCSLTVSNTTFLGNGISPTSRAIELYGQYHSINNCEFKYFTEGAIFYGDFNNNPLKVTNSIFLANKKGIMGYKDGGLNLSGNSFINNMRGAQMDNAVLASNVQSNIFKNSIYENTSGTLHGNIIDFIYDNNGDEDTAKLLINGPDRSHCAIKYKGASDLYMYDNNIKGLHTGVITENNKVSLQCNYFNNIQNSGIITNKGTLNMSAKSNNAGHNFVQNIGFSLIRLNQVDHDKILLNSGFNYFKMETSNFESKTDYNSIQEIFGLFNSTAPDPSNRVSNNSGNALTPAEASSQSSMLIQSKIKYPLAIYGTAKSINPQLTVNMPLTINRNYWTAIVSIYGPQYAPITSLQDLINPEPVLQGPGFNPTLPFFVTDNSILTQIKYCGDTAAPCVGVGCEMQRIAQICTNCDNVNTQEIGMAQTNVAANNAMNKMEDLNVVNRYKKSLSIFTDVEANATSLQGAEDMDVLSYVHEGTITALSEGLRKKQINRNNALDKAKILGLENAYSNQISAMQTTDFGKKLEKIKLLKNKAHVQHLQDKSNMAMITIDEAITFVQADAALSQEVSVKQLMKDKCFYDVSHQYNSGQIQKEQFSTTLAICQAAIDNIPGLYRTINDDEDMAFEITEELKNGMAEMPIVKEPPYRSYVNEEGQGFVIEEQRKSSMITVMPNPANNRISILAKEKLGVCTISFTDMSGRVVLTKTITLNQNEAFNLELNLNNGIYLYAIKSEGNIIDKNKLVILNQE